MCREDGCQRTRLSSGWFGEESPEGRRSSVLDLGDLVFASSSDGDIGSHVRLVVDEPVNVHGRSHLERASLGGDARAIVDIKEWNEGREYEHPYLSLYVHILASNSTLLNFPGALMCCHLLLCMTLETWKPRAKSIRVYNDQCNDIDTIFLTLLYSNFIRRVKNMPSLLSKRRIMTLQGLPIICARGRLSNEIEDLLGVLVRQAGQPLLSGWARVEPDQVLGVVAETY